MSDDDRLVRLTELARRVWPDEPRLVVDYEAQYLTASVLDSPWHNPDVNTLLKIERHPRALDALEAALLILSDPAYRVVKADECAAKESR